MQQTKRVRGTRIGIGDRARLFHGSKTTQPVHRGDFVAMALLFRVFRRLAQRGSPHAGWRRSRTVGGLSHDGANRRKITVTAGGGPRFRPFAFLHVAFWKWCSP
jgi:hypothetical protein